MPNYLIRIEVPIDGTDETDVLKKFRDWLANVDDPFRPYVTVLPDTDIAQRMLGGLNAALPVVEDFDMEALEWLHRQESEFMVPNVEWFNEGELASHESDGYEKSEPLGEGWYSRLSAPGYLDCTEWSGPFETELEAILSLYEMYGD